KILLARLSFHLVVRTAIIKACDNTVMTTSEDILGRIWQSLHEATTQGTGFTLSFLGTIGLEGQPRMRAVILRQFHQAQQQLYLPPIFAKQKFLRFVTTRRWP